RIERNGPTIAHSLHPEPNNSGWNNSTVTVTFTCGGSISGIASCTGPQTVSREGQAQPVSGTATDNAGLSATDTAYISIDETAPSITADTDRAPNSNGW